MRALLKGIALALGLLVVLALIVFGYFRRSLAVVDGVATVSGISKPVEIVRDADAVAHVFASTQLDALFGLGYAHAQDRLWQMEFQRRVGSGRLSEIFGHATVPTDRFVRTLGIHRAAAAAVQRLPPDAARQLDAYVKGVNAFLEAHHGSRLPPEFTLLGFEPEPWTGADVLVWVKMMAWDLSRNYSAEVFRHDVVGRLGRNGLADLMPPYPPDAPGILSASAMPRPEGAPAGGQISASTGTRDGSATGPIAWSASFDAGLPSLLARGMDQALGSNNWVVDGTLTASGFPLLASDPHLAAQIPSHWYLAHLSAGDLDVIGATLPGTPTVAIGRNRHVAWGETNVAVDVQDLYRERLDPAGRFAEFRGALEPLQIVSETIEVKGRAPVPVVVRISRHGPLISDAINANNAESDPAPKRQPLEPLALRWTALDSDDSTVVAFLRLHHARDWNDFTAALRYFVVPSQNFVYADAGGHIGYFAPGRIPIRASGDGTEPADGWSGEMEWTGWIPFDDLPQAFDPPEHFIVTANNRPVPPGYPHPFDGDWTEPHRAARIAELIGGKSRLTPDDFAAIQADTFSRHAHALLPVLLRLVRAEDSRASLAIDLLRRWDRDARADSAAAAIFQAWLLELTPALVADELGDSLTASYRALNLTSYVARFLSNTLSSSNSHWCDDVGTPARETCGKIVSRALQAALERLSGPLGGNLTRWRWDAVHRAVFSHAALDTVFVLGPIFNRSVPRGGDWSTVNVGPVFAPRPFEQRSIPSYRQIIDLSPAADSRFMDAVGQSGHPLSRYYDDGLRDWQAVRHRRMRMTREEAERGAIGTLKLVPALNLIPEGT